MTLIGVVIATPAVAVFALYNGWALWLLWKWFVVPAFGWPALSLLNACGLGLIAALTKGYTHRDRDEAFEAIKFEFVQPGIIILVALLLRWAL